MSYVKEVIFRWKYDFENNVLLDDEWCSVWPRRQTVDNICCAGKIFKADDCFTLNDVCRLPVGCGWSTIHIIIHKVLQSQKLSCRWVPCILTDDHMTRRMTPSLQFLMLYRLHSENILDQVIIGDETWVHNYTPPTEQVNSDGMLWAKVDYNEFVSKKSGFLNCSEEKPSAHCSTSALRHVCCTFTNSLIDEQVKEQECYVSSTFFLLFYQFF